MTQPDTAALPFRPLYAQVKEHLTARLIDGLWVPGQILPSEQQLARELGVSQGTVRKALDAMTAENLLIRKQGRGTFVAEPEESRILFQFFRLMPDSQAPVFPQSRVLGITAGAADADESGALDLAPGAPVLRIERERTLAGQPLLVETITLPTARFEGLEALEKLPNNVYQLYSQRWGITIADATETIKAISASGADAQVLGCAPGTPLLRIARVARDLARAPVELRLSRCLTDTSHYRSDLR